MKRFLHSVFLITASLSLPSVHANPDLAPAAPNLTITVFLDGQPASLILNGFPVVYNNSGDGVVLTFEALPYLKKAGNVLVVEMPRAQLNANESKILKVTLDTASPDGKTETLWLGFDRFMTLVEIDKDEVSGISRVGPVEQGSWTFGGDSLQRFEFRIEPSTRSLVAIGQQPRTFEHRFESAQGADQWILRVGLENAVFESLPWDGSVPQLTAADKTALADLTLRIREAIKLGDQSTLRDLFASKISRFATARNVSPDVMSDSLLEVFNRLNGGGNPFVFDPLSNSGLSYRTFEGAQLVEVSLNGEPPIRAVSGEDIFTKRLFFAKQGESWILVD